ncbi:MAG: hypothetical protein Q9216_007114 [Gyalolechia sp. 2 TL-2023]
MAAIDWGAIKTCFQQPTQPHFPTNRTIELRHPGYAQGSSSLLFRFPAYDHAHGGLHHHIALTACALVAGNKWNGYLSLTAAGPPVSETHDQVLRGRTYFFHPHPYISPGRRPIHLHGVHRANVSVADDPQSTAPPTACCSTPPYPLYPTFKDWPFPHGNLPPWWPSVPRGQILTSARSLSTMTTQIKVRDQTCRLTGSMEELEVPHIIPEQEKVWFYDKEMGQYSYDFPSPNNSANLFVLRKDLHASFDHLKWAIVPKSTKWCFIYLDSAEELGSLYHNVEMRPMLGVRSEYLLAAFARAVFWLLMTHLTNNADKRLIGNTVGTQDPAGLQVTGTWCSEQFGIPGERSGSRSPTKRKRPAADSTQEDEARPLSLDCGYSQSSQRMSRPLESILDRPCTCTIKRLPTPEASVSSHHQDPPELVLGDVACLSRSCRVKLEFKHHDDIRMQGLLAERARSCKGDWWEQVNDWARDCGLGERQDYDFRQFLWANGQEVMSDDGEYIDTNEAFFRQIGWNQSE